MAQSDFGEILVSAEIVAYSKVKAKKPFLEAADRGFALTLSRATQLIRNSSRFLIAIAAKVTPTTSPTGNATTLQEIETSKIPQ